MNSLQKLQAMQEAQNSFYGSFFLTAENGFPVEDNSHCPWFVIDGFIYIQVNSEILVCSELRNAYKTLNTPVHCATICNSMVYSVDGNHIAYIHCCYDSDETNLFILSSDMEIKDKDVALNKILSLSLRNLIFYPEKQFPHELTDSLPDLGADVIPEGVFESIEQRKKEKAEIMKQIQLEQAEIKRKLDLSKNKNYSGKLDNIKEGDNLPF